MIDKKIGEVNLVDAQTIEFKQLLKIMEVLKSQSQIRMKEYYEAK